jgi:TRAP-type mannitol/chloroaromatic compound transport system, large permease component
MSYEAIAILMFTSMVIMLLTGQRVFGAIGVVATVAALSLYGTGGIEMPFNAAFKLFNWYPLLTLPVFVYMGYILSESGIADDLYGMFHVFFGNLRGGLAIGTIVLMVVVSAMKWFKRRWHGDWREYCPTRNAQAWI